jgi:dipeptidyl aminopeptidase/acylaminoacyl peptidase
MKINSIVFALLLLGLPATGVAQLKPEQTLNRRTISEIRFSPAGNRAVFTVAEPTRGTSRNRHIWLLDARTREVRQFTNSAKSEFTPRWSPDGRRLAFLSDREEANQIYLLATDGGEAIRLTEGKNAVRSFEWSPDGKQIAFVAPEAKTDAEEKREKDKDDARVIDRDEKRARLWLIDVETKKLRQLTNGSWQVQEATWTPAGDRLIVAATDHPESDLETNRIFSLALGDAQLKELSQPRGGFSQLSVAPDGASVAYLAGRVDGPISHDLYLQPLSGGPARNLTGNSIDRPISGFVWRPDGTIVAVVVTGFKTRFYDIALSGKAEALSQFPVNPGSFDATTRAIAFSGETAVAAPELWLATPETGAQSVSHFNDSWKQVALVQPELVRYKSFDGLEIEAALLKPANHVTGAKLPLVVLIHGGPTGRWSDSFQAWGQLLAARGYAVLCPNVRGSTGYGFRFLEANRADWGGGDFKDVMAGIDFLIARGIADPDRLGIAGWSYGGYMASWAITQTNRFKAAMSGAGLSDLASEFGTEDGSSYDEWFFGTPYEKPQGFINSSPITFIRNVRTPTLILQGENDVIDPIGQSQQLYRGLKRYGVETEFVVYPREGHGFREEKHQLDVLNRILDWFERHLKT